MNDLAANTGSQNTCLPLNPDNQKMHGRVIQTPADQQSFFYDGAAI